MASIHCSVSRFSKLVISFGPIGPHVSGERVDLKEVDADPLPDTQRPIKIYRPIAVNYSPFMKGYDPNNYQVTLEPWIMNPR